MEPSISPQDASQLEQKHPLFRVTPLSKYLAMVLFVMLPFIGGYVGYSMAPNVDTAPLVITNEAILNDASAIPNVESNDIVYNQVFVQNWKNNNVADTYKFLEYSGNLYIFHSIPFDEGSVLKKIDDVTTFSENNYFKFEHIGASYIKDGNYVIFAGMGFDEPALLKGADPADFRLSTSSNGQVFGMDSDSVYFRGMQLDGMDPDDMTVRGSDSYLLGIVYDRDTFWFPEGNCHAGSYRSGTEAEIAEYQFPC